LAQLIDDLHIASTAIWVGGLLVLATSARPLLLTGHDRAYALETAKRLSRLAGLALLCVVLTGIYNAVTQIGFLSALWETAYGRLLLLKLAGRTRHGGARRHQPISLPACAAGLGPGVAHIPSNFIGR